MSTLLSTFIFMQNNSAKQIKTIALLPLHNFFLSHTTQNVMTEDLFRISAKATKINYPSFENPS